MGLDAPIGDAVHSMASRRQHRHRGGFEEEEETFQITVPEGVVPGDKLKATTPSEHQGDGRVPEGAWWARSTVDIIILLSQATTELQRQTCSWRSSTQQIRSLYRAVTRETHGRLAASDDATPPKARVLSTSRLQEIVKFREGRVSAPEQAGHRRSILSKLAAAPPRRRGRTSPIKN